MLNARIRLRQRSCTRCRVEGVARSRREDNMNNFTSNPKGTPRQHARGKQTRGCEPSSLKLSLLFPILSVTDGDTTRTFTYHADGQLASASNVAIGRAGAHASSDIASQCSLRSGDMRTPQTETFFWDGLALIQRGDEQFVNEPHVGNTPQKLCFGGKPQANVVERITVYWQVKMRKWVDE